MNAAEIEAIVRRSVSLQTDGQLSYLALVVCVVVVIAAIGAFLGGYFKGRGELAARETDLKKILHELEETTTAVENVKQEIEFGDWKKREEIRVRREKLEELLYAAYDLDAYLDNHRSYHAFQGIDPHESIEIGRIKSLQTLYFPSLEAEVSVLTQCAAATQIAHLGVAQDRMARVTAMNGHWQQVIPNEELVQKGVESRKLFFQALHLLRAKSGEVMNELLKHTHAE